MIDAGTGLVGQAGCERNAVVAVSCHFPRQRGMSKTSRCLGDGNPWIAGVSNALTPSRTASLLFACASAALPDDERLRVDWKALQIDPVALSPCSDFGLIDDCFCAALLFVFEHVHCLQCCDDVFGYDVGLVAETKDCERPLRGAG